jgi:RimJ/RimL family protein N-acetyltransferase
LRAFTEYAFLRFDLVRIYGYVYEWNRASARVMEKAGYVCEGRLRKSVVKEGQVMDQFLYAITR